MLTPSTKSRLKKIASGSVKDIFEEENGNLHFLFSDRVSVFDYGSIPEAIPHRGESLARFAKIIFKKLDVPSLFLGSSELGDAAIRMKKASHPKFALVAEDIHFIPLEVIFRLGVPEGSKLLKNGFKLFQRFDTPLIEFSTKLEAYDRTLTREEAKTLLPPRLEIESLENFTKDVTQKLQILFSESGLTLWDGKIELAFNSSTRELFLIDAITPDELRLTVDDYPHVPLSKEILRRWYQKTLWPAELERLKKEKEQHWKEFAPPPPELGTWRVETFSQLFIKLCECLENQSSSSLKKWLRLEVHAPKVFVSGKGGRETALRWRLEKEGCEIISNSDVADAIFVSNDGELAHGLINQLTHNRKWAVGPTKEAAQIEWSKMYGKRIAELARIPLARWTTNAEEARKKNPLPVIKQDGLAAGKGVVLPSTVEEFDETLAAWSHHKLFFEERLQGSEASVFFWIHPKGDNFSVKFLGAAQDFKRRFESDKGPNTGGMGAKSPHPTLTTPEIQKFATWAEHTVTALKQEGILFSGILFLGLLNDSVKGWTLLEYNARFGDPETQALVTLWKNPRFLRSTLGLTVDEDLNPDLATEKALCVALVHPSYPEKGEPIHLADWDISNEAQIFYSGSTSGRMAYLVLNGSNDLGAKASEILATSPWKEVLAWRKDICE